MTSSLEENSRTSERLVALQLDRPSRIRPWRRVVRILPGLVLIVGVIYCLIPIVWLLTAATKSPAELFSTTPFVPGTGLLSNLQALLQFRDGVYLQWTLNSLLYAGGGALACSLVSAAAGFALAKYRFRGKSLIFAALVAGVLLPYITLAIPQYLLAAQAGISNTYWAVLLPGIVSPFSIYLARIYAQASIPDEVLEAARVDGASEWRIFRSIALRLLVPGLVTVFLLQFVGIWNNFLLPYVMLGTENNFPLSVGLFGLMSASQERTYYSTAIVGAAVAVIPLLILFVVLQRFWRLDLLSGTVKG